MIEILVINACFSHYCCWLGKVLNLLRIGTCAVFSNAEACVRVKIGCYVELWKLHIIVLEKLRGRFGRWDAESTFSMDQTSTLFNLCLDRRQSIWIEFSTLLVKICGRCLKPLFKGENVEE